MVCVLRFLFRSVAFVVATCGFSCLFHASLSIGSTREVDFRQEGSERAKLLLGRDGRRQRSSEHTPVDSFFVIDVGCPGSGHQHDVHKSLLLGRRLAGNRASGWQGRSFY